MYIDVLGFPGIFIYILGVKVTDLATFINFTFDYSLARHTCSVTWTFFKFDKLRDKSYQDFALK